QAQVQEHLRQLPAVGQGRPQVVGRADGNLHPRVDGATEDGDRLADDVVEVERLEGDRGAAGEAEQLAGQLGGAGGGLLAGGQVRPAGVVRGELLAEQGEVAGQGGEQV